MYNPRLNAWAGVAKSFVLIHAIRGKPISGNVCVISRPNTFHRITYPPYFCSHLIEPICQY